MVYERGIHSSRKIWGNVEFCRIYLIKSSQLGRKRGAWNKKMKKSVVCDSI